MPYTPEFYNILRKNKRKFGEDAISYALREAFDAGVNPFQKRKEWTNRFKRQKSNNSFFGL